MENDLNKGAKNGLPNKERVAEHGREIRTDAEKLINDAKSAASDLSRSIDIKGRMERNPLGTIAMGFGIGFLLGGGLFSRMTGRLFGLGFRMAVLPYLKYELMGRAADLVRGGGGGGVESGTAGEGYPATDRGY